MDGSRAVGLIAGSSGPERASPRPDPNEPRWFEPPHIRDVDAARQRIADQVAAGADIVIAPTWRTHRRALLPIGETRRARAWTQAAADVARQAIEAGLERRERDAAEPSDSETPARPFDEPPTRPDDRIPARLGDGEPIPAARPERPTPLLAGVLPRLDADEDGATGRLDPDDVATERDHRDQAGLLADAGVDLVVVEELRTVSSTRAAIDGVAATGRAAWVAAPPELASSDDDSRLERWVATCIDAGATVLLVPPAGDLETVERTARTVVAADVPWGAVIGPAANHEPDLLTAWLDRGAGTIARLRAADPDALAPIRETLDAHIAAWRTDAAARAARIDRFVASAAAVAPGGDAIWLRPDVASADDARRPPGFAWVTVTAADVGALPGERYRLVVDTDGVAPIDSLAGLLERGGVVATTNRDGEPIPDGVHILTRDEGSPTLVLLRREG